jgi:hypothetical protein
MVSWSRSFIWYFPVEWLKKEKIRGRTNRGKRIGGSREGKKKPHILVGNEADILVRWSDSSKAREPELNSISNIIGNLGDFLRGKMVFSIPVNCLT